MTEKTNLLGFDETQLRSWLINLGEKPFRAQQIIQWIHQYGITDFSQMTNLSKPLRDRLTEVAEVRLPEVVVAQHSDDGTRKWLIRLDDGNCIETVLIPEPGRATLCISSQVGCSLNCSFCSTGHQGFNRNLSSSEIISQLWIVVRDLSKENGRHDRQVTNVVFMGMGEPLLNFEPVLATTNLMIHDYAYGLSKYRVTLSTSGLVPMMYELAKVSNIALAVSLHAPNDKLRDVLVPINKKHPLKDLIQACKDFFADEPRRKVTIEYVMLDGVNDSSQHARELIQLLKGVPCKVNLIPFNPFPETLYRCSKPEVIARFSQILQHADILTTTRRTRGDDIDAACGQLAGEFQDKTQRKSRRLIPIRVEQQLRDLGENV